MGQVRRAWVAAIIEPNVEITLTFTTKLMASSCR
jgi:hypothetical protein